MEQDATENTLDNSEENKEVSNETEDSPGTQTKPDEVDEEGPKKEGGENLQALDTMDVPGGDTASDTHDQGTSPLPGETGEEVADRVMEGEDVSQEGEKQQEDDHEASSVSIKVDIKPSRSSSGKIAGQRSGSGKAEGASDERIPSRDPSKDDVLKNPGSQSPVNIGNEGADEHLAMDGIHQLSDLTSSTLTESPLLAGMWRTIRSKQTVDGEEQETTIHILTEKFKKPFLGGFRHRLTDVEYHNASCQTYPKKRLPSSVEKFHRDTQTVQNKNQIQQTFENTSTQMTKPGCYVSNVPDKVIIPGIYETADEKFARRLEKVIILQCHWRRWLATRYVQKLRHDKEVRLEWERQEEIRKQKEREERIRKEFERRMNPKSKEDFDLLYAALERWRREEIDKIDSTRAGPERKAALVGLLEQESYLIASIERHRIKANKENKESSIRKFLDTAAAPKKWSSIDGTTILVETPYTLRAQELRDLYNSLQMKYLTQEERLDVLLTLKHTVKEHECKLTHEIVELIDRETNMLMRGIKDKSLDGLRQRTATLFIQFCKIPLFNPEAARLLKVPQDPSTLRKNVYFCPSCTSYLPSSEFPLASNSKIVGRCRRCAKIDNDARLRQDFSKFRMMLLALRNSEESYNDGSKIAFIMQEADLRYLVENIWNGQSALSAWEELYDLVSVRWNKYEHWSPWNCVLLTKEEADAHARLEKVNEGYGRIFIGKVHNRHVLGQKHFSKLTDVADKMITRADKKLKAQQEKQAQPQIAI